MRTPLIAGNWKMNLTIKDSVKLVSDERPENLPDFIKHEVCPKMSNIDEWNYGAIYELPKHVDTEFAMLIHDDGFVVNPESWKEEFLEYDYIGAPYPLPQDNFSYRDIKGDLIRATHQISTPQINMLLHFSENW